MARRKIGKEQIRKLQHSSGSYLLRLPIQLVRELGWQERQKVVVLRSGAGISIKDWPASKPKKLARKKSRRK